MRYNPRARMAAGVPAALVAAIAILGGAATVRPPAIAEVELGVEDAALTRLFTPPAAPPGVYRVYRSPRPIVELAAVLRALDPEPVEDAWKVGPLAPVDAFGSNAPYDAPRLARLYVGTMPLVARGSLATRQGRIAYTLIAPFPDPALTTLQPGTMIIVCHVTALTGWR